MDIRGQYWTSRRHLFETRNDLVKMDINGMTEQKAAKIARLLNNKATALRFSLPHPRTIDGRYR